MTEPALITILLPIRRPHEGYFVAALHSVKDQTSADWRLLVVVDDAEDESVVSRLLTDVGMASDLRTAVLRNESSLLSGAVNTGMRQARTPFVTLLLGDDELELTAMEVLQRSIVEFPDADFFHSSRIFIDEQGQELSGTYRARESVDAADFINGSPVKHLMCWRREFGLEIGGVDETLGVHGADDYDFPWTAAEAGCRFQAVQECLYRYRDHREHFRLTTHIPLDRQAAELEKIWRKHGLSPEEMQAQLDRRRAGYLQQALYLDAEDEREKTDEGWDPREGWRHPYG